MGPRGVRMGRDIKKGLGVDGRTNIHMDVKEIDVSTKNWVESAQDREY